MKRENFHPSKYSKICSKHFEDSCFDKQRFGHPFLIKGSVPTLFDFPEHLKKKVWHRKPPKPRVVGLINTSQSYSSEQPTTVDLSQHPTSVGNSNERINTSQSFSSEESTTVDLPQQPTSVRNEKV